MLSSDTGMYSNKWNRTYIVQVIYVLEKVSSSYESIFFRKRSSNSFE